MYEIIFLTEFYSNSNLTILAGYINHSKKKRNQSKNPTIGEAQEILLFFQVKTPNMLFTLRTYGEHFMHVRNNLFCALKSPVGPIMVRNDKITDNTAQKIRQWLKQELNLLGFADQKDYPI